MELLWAMFMLGALAAAIVALVKAYRTDAEAQGAIDLETSERFATTRSLQKDHNALEGVTDSHTKRLNDHYSLIRGLQGDVRRQRSEIRQLTRTVEALAASHGRQSNSLSALIKRVVGVPEKGERR